MPVSSRFRLAWRSSNVRWLGLALGCLAAGCRPESTTTAPTPTSVAPSERNAEKTGVPADPLKLVEGDIEVMMNAFDVPGLAIAIVRGDEVVFARGYGVREAGKRDPVDPDTVFAVASNTKAFVATTLGLLVTDGQLDWDDRVVAHLPDLKLWDEYTTSRLRVRDLLCHRSGLDTWAGDLSWIGSRIDTDQLVARLRHVPAAHDFRERYGYTNLMYVLAGEVIEAKTGKPWHEVVRDRLLQPLGMTRTVASVDDLPSLGNVAAPHMGRHDARRVIPYLNVDNAGPAGALNSSVADMARWIRMQLGHGELDGRRIVPDAVIEVTRQPHTLVPQARPPEPPQGHFVAYGLGWVLHDYAGRLVVTHSGGLPGMISRVTLVPEEQLGVVVLTNNESPTASLLAATVVDRFLGLEPPDRVTRALQQEVERAETKAILRTSAKQEPSLPLPRYAGTFRNPLLGRAEVRLEGDGLVLDLSDHGNLRCPLVHHDADTFSCTWADPIFEHSLVHFRVERNRSSSLHVQVRPDFIDPLDYTFTR